MPPWEKYQTQAPAEAGPWAKYAAQPTPTAEPGPWHKFKALLQRGGAALEKGQPEHKTFGEFQAEGAQQMRERQQKMHEEYERGAKEGPAGIFREMTKEGSATRQLGEQMGMAFAPSEVARGTAKAIKEPTGVPKPKEVMPDQPVQRPNKATAPATPSEPGPKPPVMVPAPVSRAVDDFHRIFSPGKRGPASEKTAGMMREAMATREQSYQQAAENLRGFGRVVGNLSPPEKLAFMDAIETGAVPKGSPVAPLAKEIRGLFDDRWKKMDERGIAPGYIQDYLPHLWQDPAKAAETFSAYYGKRSLEGRKSFTKERTLATIKEGMDAGLKPVTDNPIELSLMQLHQMDKFITAQDVIREMEGEGLALRVPHDERAPEGWIPIDDKIARKGNTTLYAPEQAATIVNRALSPGLAGMPIYDTIRSAGNMMNSAQLGMSAFHAAFVTADAATSAVAKGVKQISRLSPSEVVRGVGSIAKAPAAPVMNYLRGRKMMLQYLGRGQYPEMEPIVDALIKGGGRAKMDSFYRGSAAGSFWQAMRGSLVRSSGRATLGQEIQQMFHDAQPINVGGVPVASGVVRAAAQLVPRVMDTIMAPIMEDLVPKMKLGVFFDLMKDELRLNPTMDLATKRTVAGRIWDSVDNRLGQLAYDNLFWNKSMKDFGHIAVRSLGWNLGTIRELAGGTLDVAKGRGIEAGNMKQITDRASYVVAMPIMTAMMGAFYAYLKGTWRPEQGVKDYFFPPTGGRDAQGGPERANMPGYFKDAFEWSHQPLQTAKGKIHPLWQTIYSMMTNEQWNGAAIADTRKGVGLPQVKDYAAWFLSQFMPLSIRPAPSSSQSAISGGEQFFGIRPAPYAVREPERAEKAERTIISRKVKKGQRAGQTYGGQ